MKFLTEFAATHQLIIVPITYRFNGFTSKRKGYSLIDERNQIQVDFEPYNVSKDSSYAKDKWKVSDNTNNRFFYMGKITKNALLKHFPNFKPIPRTGHILKI